MKKGVNIVLIIVLAGLVGTLGFFSYKLFFKEDKIIVPDFTNATKQDVETWCNSFESNPCKFETDFSDSVAEGQVIYQSISANEELGDNIAFIISAGKKIEIVTPQVTSETKKVDIINWAKENSIPNPIEYVEENSDEVEIDYVIKLEPAILTDETTSIKVFVSIGPNDENKDDKKDSSDIVVTFGDYINISEDDFKSKVAKINLTPNHKESKDAYSNTIPQGNIVWHGSGSYTKNETINYGLSLGKKEGADEEITWPMVIKKTDFAGKSLDEFTELMKKYGLKPTHRSEWDDYSDTIEKGYILRNGEGTYYEDDETISYALSLGKKDGSDSEDDEITWPVTIKRTDYAGKSLDEFTKLMKKYGLKPTHRSEWDDYSDTIEKGYILRNGEGTYYENDETISYALSLGKKGGEESGPIYIKENEYYGKSEDEFKKIANNLGLVPVHNADWDKYSDSLEKGKIIRHGYTDYVKGENFRYGLSLGPKGNDPVTPDVPDTPTIKQVTVDGSKYMNISVDSFKSKISELGLSTNHNSNYDAYSSYPEGNICWYNSGTFDEGSTISYGVSKGVEKKHLNGFSMIANSCESIGNYEQTASNVKSYFEKQGFSNVECIGAKGGADDESVGVIMSISINGSSSYSAGDYPIDVSIVVTICNEVQN